MNRFLAATLVALTVLCDAQAAAPASGTLSTGTPELAFSSGPFPVANATTETTPENPTCAPPALPCDDYALTVDLPASYPVLRPLDLITISTFWPVANQIAYNLYLLDAAGAVISYVATGNDPVTLSVPAQAGSYTVRIVPHQAAGDMPATTIRLVADGTGAPATGLPPRFHVQAPPEAIGQNTGGEMNIGYNPASGRVMTLAYIKTLRTTFAENLDPPLAESCAALWEDVSEPLSQQNTNDPILFTDPQTGRTFVSQLQPNAGQSLFFYTDDDGETWTQVPSTLDGGADHQTVGGGPYSASGTAGPAGDYPNAVYYCSQSIAAAFCMRSDDGGDTFLAPAVLKNAADCGGFLGAIHGHIRVGLDGMAYVPDRNCGGTHTLFASSDSGDSWEKRPLPPTATAGDNDPSVGLGSDGTVYFCYINGDGHPHVAVSHDQGLSWESDRDIGYRAGVVRAVFPQAVAGDGDRAACAFLGTTTPGNFQSTDFEGLWHGYVAMTYDGGDTWHTVNGTPGDPVQGMGGICVAGTTCIENRNLLDFNEITADERGRVLFGFDDGCISQNCITTGAPDQVAIPGLALNSSALTTVLRQSGGRTLRAAVDPTEPVAPKAACLAGARDETGPHLTWRAPDNGGGEVVGYRLYRGAPDSEPVFLAQTGPVLAFDDAGADPQQTYRYRVTALNGSGESVASNAVTLEGSGGGTGGGTTGGATTGGGPAAQDDRFGGALGLGLVAGLFGGFALRRRRPRD